MPRTAKPPTPPASLRTPEKSLDLSQSLPFSRRRRLACNNHTRGASSTLARNRSRESIHRRILSRVPSARAFLPSSPPPRPRRRRPLRSLERRARARVSVPSDRSQPPSFVHRRPTSPRPTRSRISIASILSPLLRAQSRARAPSRASDVRASRLSRARAPRPLAPPPSPPRPRTTRPRARRNATSPPTSTRARRTARARVASLARSNAARATSRPA